MFYLFFKIFLFFFSFAEISSMHVKYLGYCSKCQVEENVTLLKSIIQFDIEDATFSFAYISTMYC